MPILYIIKMLHNFKIMIKQTNKLISYLIKFVKHFKTLKNRKLKIMI